MNSEEQDLELVKKACENLEEHFDSIQIFTTRHEAGEANGTVCVKWGSGNWFSRYGVVKEWIVKSEEDSRLSCRSNES